ncbi:transposase [Streptomyces sp. NPDC005791]|uniref:transposase n=1 Tax=Streptomyces sp. NPDC005791 TaxID=3364732 RepID=UPI00368CA42F
MMPLVADDLSPRLVPDGLWALMAPLLPEFASRPQGGGTSPVDARAVFTAVVYPVTSGCAWRHPPPTFGVSPATAHRRFTCWTEAGLWRRLHRVILDELGARGELDRTSAIIAAASARATRGGRVPVRPGSRALPGPGRPARHPRGRRPGPPPRRTDRPRPCHLPLPRPRQPGTRRGVTHTAR